MPAGVTTLASGNLDTSWDFNPGGQNYYYDNPYGDYPQHFGQGLKEYDVYSDGSEQLRVAEDYRDAYRGNYATLGSGKELRSSLIYDIGYSYVAMGEWTWRVVDLNGNPTGDSGDLFFVNGTRTPPTGIPASGTATYSAAARGVDILPANFTLTADFGLRSISAQIGQNYQYLSPSWVLPGIQVSGSTAFSNDGLFDIPLSGTMSISPTNSPLAPPPQPVTGSIDGGFFGPHAEDVGGTFHLDQTSGTTLLQGPFVGERH